MHLASTFFLNRASGFFNQVTTLFYLYLHYYDDSEGNDGTD